MNIEPLGPTFSPGFSTGGYHQEQRKHSEIHQERILAAENWKIRKVQGGF